MDADSNYFRIDEQKEGFLLVDLLVCQVEFLHFFRRSKVMVAGDWLELVRRVQSKVRRLIIVLLIVVDSTSEI
jgi:hypothetical protein